MLNDEEKKTLLAARSELMEAKHTSKDAESVKTAIKNMEKVAEFYVARRMDDNVKKAMAGHNVDEFNK
jgi:molecular chaperone HscA